MQINIPVVEGAMGARLRELRQRRGLTLDEAGVVAGYTRSMMSKIERGKRPLSPEAAIRLARVLRVPVRELFGANATR